MTSGWIAFWLLPAAVSFALTYLEGVSAGEGRWTLWRVAGLLACLLWPLTLPVFVAFALLHARSARAKARRNLRPRLISQV